MKVADIVKEKLFLHGAYVRLFASEDGKLVLRHLMKNGFIFNTTFVPGDPHQTAMNEGTRRMVLSILRFVNKDHKELVNQVEQELQNDTT